jgi:hypothetical protein
MHISQLSNQLDALQGGVRDTIGSTVPDTEGKTKIIPLEVNIKLLQNSMKRLVDGRWKAHQRKDRILSHASDGYSDSELPAH